MKIAVLFDGAGLARLGLERAGHECTGVELDPWKHHLSQFVGSGNCILADATKIDLSEFDAVWASPPCQLRSSSRTQGAPISKFAGDYLSWALQLYRLPNLKALWVENVVIQGSRGNEWGRVWNAAQFQIQPIQNRNRVIGGYYNDPIVFHGYRKFFPGICPCVTATEHKGCASDARRASRFYGRKLTVEDCAYHQGLEIPDAWYDIPADYIPPAGKSRETAWRNNIYEAIGNGVPVYMAESFGRAYSDRFEGDVFDLKAFGHRSEQGEPLRA